MKLFSTLMLFLVVQFGFSQKPQSDNLISSYEFFENLNDTSGNLYSGTVTGTPSFTTDRFGNNNAAVLLDGVDDYIYFGNGSLSEFANTNASFSISIWAKSTSTSTLNLLSLGEEMGMYTACIIRMGNSIQFNSFNEGFSTSASGKNSDGQWHQYVFVWDYSTKKRHIYIDGTLIASKSPAVSGRNVFNIQNYGLAVGRDRFQLDGTTNLYQGSVDDVKFWNMALSSSDVSSLYAYDNTSSNFTPPIEPFITSWEIPTAGTTLSFPLQNYTNITIDWGDGTTSSSLTGSSNPTHTYTNSGSYSISVLPDSTNDIGKFYAYGNNQARDYLKDIKQWGSGKWETFYRSFYNCLNMTITATDAPDLSMVTDMSNAFYNCDGLTTETLVWNTSKVTNMISLFSQSDNFNGDISSWNTSSVTNMNSMFDKCYVFNQDLSTKTVANTYGNYVAWDVSNVTNMSVLFRGNYVFNADISNWDTSSVTTMSEMFRQTRAFNQNVNTKVVSVGGESYVAWDTSNVTSLYRIFTDAKVFNTDIGNWNTTNVTNMAEVFYGATVFNQSIDTKSVTVSSTYDAWTVSAVTTLSKTFDGASNFNQSLANWDVSSVKDMSNTFRRASKFNGDISTWNTSSVTNFASTFSDAVVFNGDISSWNTSSATYMGGMFDHCYVFNQDLSTKYVTNSNGNYTAWDVSNVTNMGSMFRGNYLFNADISNWNTSAVTNLSQMFRQTKVFNQNIDTKSATVNGTTYTAWNTANVTTFYWMFESAYQFNSSLSNWNTAKVTTMKEMFVNARAFNQDLSSWDTSNVTTMQGMFKGALAFNGDLTNWNTSKVTIMSDMFNGAIAFNQPLTTQSVTVSDTYTAWNTSLVTNMSNMFINASKFNQDLSSWNVEAVTNLSNFLNNTTLCRSYYDAILESWATQTLVSGVNVYFGNAKYSNTSSVTTARATIDATWGTITDGGIENNTTAAIINSTSLSADNTQLTVTFSDSVFSECNGTGDIDESLFELTMSGGTATLSQTTPLSLSYSGVNSLTFILEVPLVGEVDGNELITVTPKLTSLYDSNGNVVLTTQSNNTKNTNSRVAPNLSLTSQSFNYGDPVFAITSTTSSTGAINFSSSNTSVVSIDASTGSVTINGVGTSIITAVQTQTQNYEAATATTTITIDKGTAPISGLSAINTTYNGASITLTGVSSNTNTIAYSSSDIDVAVVSGTTLSFVGAGTATLTAVVLTDDNYNEATASVGITVARDDAPISGLSAINATYNDTSISLTGVSSNTNTIAYSSSDTDVAVVSGTTLSFVGAGTATLTAVVLTDDNYNEATASVGITVSKDDAPISGLSTINATYNDTSISLMGVSSNTNTITYSSSDTDVAVVSGSTLNFVGAGTATLTAVVAADSNYNEATASVGITVSKDDAPISGLSTINATYNDTSISLMGVSSNTNTITYSSSDTDVAVVSGSTLNFVGAGTATLTAVVAADSNYNEAANSVGITVTKDEAAISGLSTINVSFNDAPLNLTGVSSNTNTISYSSSDTDVAVVSGTLLTIVGGGSAVITASVSADTNYSNATSSFTVNVAKIAPIISFDDVTKTYGDVSFELESTSTSSGALAYTSADESIAKIEGNTLIITGSGSTTIQLNQASDSNYLAAQTQMTLLVEKKGIYVYGLKVLDKVYDTTREASVDSSEVVFNGIESGDDLKISATALFENANAASSINVFLNSSYSGASLSNYTITDQLTTSASIVKAPLTVKVNSVSKIYTGLPYSNFTVTYDGFVGSENKSNLSGTLVFSGPGTSELVQGSYKVSVSGLSSNNYAITFVDGTYAITDGDIDLDGIGDTQDDDIDGDGILNGCDADINGDATLDNGVDTDGDGIKNSCDTDDDGDGTLDINDDFPLDKNEDTDTDKDGIGNNEDTDDDNDGQLDVHEMACGSDPLNATKKSLDSDFDGIPNCVDTDDDNDGVLDINDAFPLIKTEWVDTDGDGIGNNSDPDDDNDGLSDEDEVIAGTNSLIVDSDQDGVLDGTEVIDKTNPLDACSLILEHQTETAGMTYWDTLDCDQDGVPNSIEIEAVFELAASRSIQVASIDSDGDGIPNYLDSDDDGDGVLTSIEVSSNTNQDGEYVNIDTDGDGIPDYMDTDDDGDGIATSVEYTYASTTFATDSDNDGIPNYLDADDDNDGILTGLEMSFSDSPLSEYDTDGDGIPNYIDSEDNYPSVVSAINIETTNFELLDTDRDGIPNLLDVDDDNDGFSDQSELSCSTNPLRIESQPGDLDRDGIANCIDDDMDGDGVANELDAFPMNAFEYADYDGDGIGDNFDADDDNDGIIDTYDAFPFDASETSDIDKDGIGDNADIDIFNDGFNDNRFEVSGVLSPNQIGIESTWKITNINLHPLNKVSVYNADGIEVFSAENYQNDWRGTFKDTNELLPIGSYYYKVYLYDTKEQSNGWLYLVY
jgi:gliding motility-associated-like protein